MKTITIFAVMCSGCVQFEHNRESIMRLAESYDAHRDTITSSRETADTRNHDQGADSGAILLRQNRTANRGEAPATRSGRPK